MSSNLEKFYELKKASKKHFQSSEVIWCDSYSNEDIKESLNFAFVIHGYDLLMKKKNPGEFIHSPNFKMKKNMEIQWCLKVYPNGINSSHNNDLGIYLHLITTNLNVKVNTSFSITLLKNDGSTNLSKNSSFAFTAKFPQSGFLQFMKIRDLKRDASLMPGNVLTLLCSIDASYESRINHMGNLKNSNLINNNCKVEEEVKNYLEILCEDSRFSDVTLVVENKELKAHKCILAVASPIFSSIFEQNEKEKSNSVITISDLSYEVAAEMLHFIYKKEVEHLHDVAHELIGVAHRYGISELKKVCEESLCQNIKLDNALKLLVIADLNNAKGLKDDALRFIVAHKKDFIDNEELKEIIKTNPELSQSIIFSMVSFN